MNARYLLAALCLAALSPVAKADKFHLGSKADAEKMTAGQPDAVEGVLLKDENDRYVVRVEGGQIELLKANVYKVEKTGLTVAQIEQREDESREQLAQLDAQRSAWQSAVAEAEMQRIREVRAAEATAEVDASLAPQPADAAPAMMFDPVIGIVREAIPGVYNADYYVRKELGGLIRRRLSDAARFPPMSKVTR